MTEKTDVAVIGASPAGLMAARYAVLGGADVVLYEKKEEIGVPCHPANSVYRGMMSANGEKIDRSYVRHCIDGMKLVSPAGRTITVETPGYALDKEKFDKFYAEKAEKAGVRIECGYDVCNLSSYFGENVLNVKKTTAAPDEAPRKIKADLVIIADGIFSQTAVSAGLRTMKHPEDVAWGTELEIEAPGIGEEKFAEYYVGSHAPGWKSTYLPMGKDRAAVGVYVRRHGKDISGFLDPWVDRICEMKDIDRSEMKIVSNKSGGDPIITIPDQICKSGIMVVGGAAGQSGIGYAMQAGKIAGETAAQAVSKGDFSKRMLSQYVYRWKDALWTEHIFGRIGLEALRKMDDEEIDELFEVFEDEDVSSKIHGSTFGQGLSVMALMMKKKPSAILKAGALFRNR